MAGTRSVMPQYRRGFTWRLVALLGFAMMTPVGLPAGGGMSLLPEVRRRERDGEPLISSACTSLRCAPEHQAPVLVQLEPGSPLRLLRQWLGSNGNHWLQVEAISPAGNVVRGWLRS